MTTYTTTTPHTDPLAAAVAAMHQLAATDWATMKHTLEAEERPGPVPSPSVLEYAYAGAFLSELGYAGNHESTRLWKIDTTELQAAHRFILGITERHRTELATIENGSQEQDERMTMMRVRSRALNDLAKVIRARVDSKRRW